jgi:hypothetical protein
MTPDEITRAANLIESHKRAAVMRASLDAAPKASLIEYIRINLGEGALVDQLRAICVRIADDGLAETAARLEALGVDMAEKV